MSTAGDDLAAGMKDKLDISSSKNDDEEAECWLCLQNGDKEPLETACKRLFLPWYYWIVSLYVLYCNGTYA